MAKLEAKIKGNRANCEVERKGKQIEKLRKPTKKHVSRMSEKVL